MKPESSKGRSNLKKNSFDFTQISNSLNEIDLISRPPIIEEEKNMIKKVDNPLNDFSEISETLRGIEKKCILREPNLKKQLFKKRAAKYAEKQRQRSIQLSKFSNELMLLSLSDAMIFSMLLILTRPRLV
ncbi:hypothetical protein ACFE04_010246 [Oxalis oulophora]